MLTGGFGLNDAKIDDFDGTQRFVDNTTPNTYKYTANLGAQYEVALGADTKAAFRVDYTKLGQINYDVSGVPNDGPTDWLNARASFQHKNWIVALWGRNLTDEKQFTLVAPNSLGAGTSTGYLVQPRTYGIELQHKL
jgi:outer membrane receptor protein involved in Fe transport